MSSMVKLRACLAEQYGKTESTDLLKSIVIKTEGTDLLSSMVRLKAHIHTHVRARARECAYLFYVWSRSDPSKPRY